MFAIEVKTKRFRLCRKYRSYNLTALLSLAACCELCGALNGCANVARSPLIGTGKSERTRQTKRQQIDEPTPTSCGKGIKRVNAEGYRLTVEGQRREEENNFMDVSSAHKKLLRHGWNLARSIMKISPLIMTSNSHSMICLLWPSLRNFPLPLLACRCLPTVKISSSAHTERGKLQWSCCSCQPRK